MDFIAGISAVSKAIEFAKTIKDIDTAFSQAEMKSVAAQLMSSLADVKMSLVEAQEINTERAETIKRLKGVLQKASESVEVYGYLYEQIDGQPIGFPYCPRCITIDGVAIKLVRTTSGHKAACPECRRDYNASHYASPQRPGPSAASEESGDGRGS